MLTNGGCTMYFQREGGDYRRVFCPACHWEDTRARNFNRTGAADVDSVKVFLPGELEPGPRGERDYIVRGECLEELEEGGVARFLSAYTAFTITSISDFRFGGLPHWEVGAK